MKARKQKTADAATAGTPLAATVMVSSVVALRVVELLLKKFWTVERVGWVSEDDP